MKDEPPVPRKSLGQHWLSDVASLLAICEAAKLKKTDAVLEIGPGPGALTKLLVNKADRVVAVELDEKLARGLPNRLGAGNLEVINEDILRFDLRRLPSGYKVVANIPYYLTSNLIRRLSETPNPPTMAVLLLQKEVAERATAGPGGMSLLSVTAQFYWQASLGVRVPARAFTPPPKVDSQLLILKRRTRPLLGERDAKSFFRLVKAGFSQRRKTLRNSLSAGLNVSRGEVEKLCAAAAVEAGRRPQTLSLDEWQRLYRALVINR